jgi:hypothetical protein
MIRTLLMLKNTGHRHRFMYIQSYLIEQFISLKTVLKQDTLVFNLYLLIEKAKHVAIKFNVFNPSLWSTLFWHIFNQMCLRCVQRESINKLKKIGILVRVFWQKLYECCTMSNTKTKSIKARENNKSFSSTCLSCRTSTRQTLQHV